MATEVRGRGGERGLQGPTENSTQPDPCSPINLPRNIHSLCERNHKTLQREAESPKIERLGRSGVIKMSVPPTLGYEFNMILIKIPVDIFSYGARVETEVNMET